MICILGDRRVGGTRLVRLRMGDLDLNREWGKKLLFARMNGLRSKVFGEQYIHTLQRISYRKVNGIFRSIRRSYPVHNMIRVFGLWVILHTKHALKYNY